MHKVEFGNGIYQDRQWATHIGMCKLAKINHTSMSILMVQSIIVVRVSEVQITEEH